MGWSFRIAQVAGIDIKVHITFFLILLLGAFPWGTQYGLQGALFGVTLIILLFVCVTLHELGHSIAAKLLGVPVREIVLLPLGGVALLRRMPEKPQHELLIAIAGPLVNVVIAGVLLLVTGATAFLGVLDAQGLVQGNAGAEGTAMPPGWGTMLLWLLQANIVLVLFNMIPAFPLDGGRVLRALLAMVMPYPRATRIASSVGQVIAIGFGLFGFFSGNFLLILVAIFVFFGAGQESTEGQARTVLKTLRVGDAYNKHALTLSLGDRVNTVVDYILTSYQPDFAVMQGNIPIGIVTRDDVMRALASNNEDMYVTMIMRRDFAKVEAHATLEEVRQTMSENSERVVAVYNGDTYLGLVSIEDISEAFAVISFMRRQQEGQPPAQSEAEA